eukprot:TRINITY_DN5501_c2_g1_i1.p1 TRINITY_DN5501_c2_g1~~TRINITY_DN5501_c2_g1_i1.p1  ORF type:complete len:519 (+),score=184.17 TRINITY_DN5501_c2_g1_i1:57-1559(+)
MSDSSELDGMSDGEVLSKVKRMENSSEEEQRRLIRRRVKQYPARYGESTDKWFLRGKGTLELMFTVQGTVWDYCLPNVIFITCIATAVYLLDRYGEGVSVSGQGHTYMLSPLSFLLVFSCSHSYSRYWDGCQLFSKLNFHVTNIITTLSCYHMSSREQEIRQLIRDCGLLVNAVCVCMYHKVVHSSARARIRMGKEDKMWCSCCHEEESPSKLRADLMSDLDGFLDDSVKERLPHFATDPSDPTLVPLVMLHRRVGEAMREGVIHSRVAGYLSEHIQGLQSCLGLMMRTASTPLSFPWLHMMKVSMWIWLVTVPFPLVTAFKDDGDGTGPWIAIPVTFFIAFLLFGLQNLSALMENPFGTDIQDFSFLEEYLLTVRNMFLVKEVATAQTFLPRSPRRKGRKLKQRRRTSPPPPPRQQQGKQAHVSPEDVILQTPAGRESPLHPPPGPGGRSPGDLVYVNWEGVPTPAKVQQRHADGTYTIKWEDGSVSDRVVSNHFVRMS